jgi:flagellar basal-body rod modification protein FlgD
MPINAVTETTASAVGNQAMDLQAFMKILLTQLNYQDPMKPMDNQQFMAQIAQFTSLEQTQQMNANLQQLVSNQAALQSVGLIGRSVTVLQGGTTVAGTVQALTLSGDAPVVTVLTTSGAVLNNLALSQIASVK